MTNKTHNSAQYRRAYANLRARALAGYGDRCICCSVTYDLTLDHVAGNGKEDRLRFGSGSTFYRWIVNNGHPPGFQILCGACNRSKGRGERCNLDHSQTRPRAVNDDLAAEVKRLRDENAQLRRKLEQIREVLNRRIRL